ncbi:Protein TRM32 [Frankliniella fusca]|uniref:Protein TRM32 n=1 Tax=Frankliniella fusca TaxID=407009 RepID=A0AAE1HPN8_9NEOP|nr:Protein TRM32 [Frankliniella fusca]
MANQMGQFALVFCKDPSSAEIFKCTEFEDPNGLFEVGAIRRVKQRSWQECSGTILCIGTKKALSQIKVDSNGVINISLTKEEAIQNRFQELAKMKKMATQSQAAKEKHMSELNARLLANGPDSLPSSSKTAEPKKKSKKRKATPEERTLLEEQLKALPYKTKRIGDWQLSTGDDVYLKGSTLLAITKCYCKAPTLMFRSILDEVIPREISMYVMNTCKENNIEATYDLNKLVTNYIEHRQDPDRKKNKKSGGEKESVNVDDITELTDNSSNMTDNSNAVSADWDSTEINVATEAGTIFTEAGTIFTESDTQKTYRSI